jgi:hypothetical protein
VDKYPAAAGIRGTIELDAPSGAQIGALGIRIPIAHIRRCRRWRNRPIGCCAGARSALR